MRHLRTVLACAVAFLAVTIFAGALPVRAFTFVYDPTTGIYDCPNYNGVTIGGAAPAISPSLLAFSTSGTNPITYSAVTTNQSPSMGIPGIIEYCVYPNGGNIGIVTSGTPIYVGAVGPWIAKANCGGTCWEFDRDGGGDPNNIPLNGATVTVGSLLYNTLPSSSLIVFHINWLAECQALNSPLDPSNTCFVTVGQAPPPNVPELPYSSAVGLLAVLAPVVFLLKRRTIKVL